ncbi:hypothetical protein IFM89_013410 [Coptis chinensis]|uniref:Uncharacterized protein n=1 Tax=Coptis chinensis TaxID=261450 RepID=A0A835GZ27_9MAGN|nr:hypothetical protein IFM89_013410 [Coptis chinensis]
MWTRDAGCKNGVRNAMARGFSGPPSFSFCRNLSACRKELMEWNHKCFGNLDVKLKQLDRKLTECQEQQHRCVSPTEQQLIQEQSLLLEYEEVLRRKDIHWGQKSRQDWYGMGEFYTKYFHTVVINRRRRNDINRLVKLNGEVLTQRLEIGDHLYSTTQICSPPRNLNMMVS